MYMEDALSSVRLETSLSVSAELREHLKPLVLLHNTKSGNANTAALRAKNKDLSKTISVCDISSEMRRITHIY